MKPFLFVRGQRHYARFLVPEPHRTLSNGKKYLVIALGAREPHIIRQRAVYAETALLSRMRQGVDMTNNRENFMVFDLVLGNGTRIENINTSSDVDNLLKLAQAESLKDLLESLGASGNL